MRVADRAERAAVVEERAAAGRGRAVQDLADEDRVIAAGHALLDRADEVRDGLGEDRWIGALDQRDAGELVLGAAGEAPRELLVALAQHVDGEAPAGVDRLVGRQAVVDADDEQHGVERQRAHGAGRHPGRAALVGRRDHGDPRGEVSDRLAEGEPVDRRVRHVPRSPVAFGRYANTGCMVALNVSGSR